MTFRSHHQIIISTLLGEKHGLRVFEKSLKKNIFRHKKEETTGG